MLVSKPDPRAIRPDARRRIVIKGLTYAIVTTDDVPRARQFYTKKLGLGTEDDMGDTFSQFTTREGAPWALMARPPHAAPLSAELYLQVDDADAAHKLWRERGVEMVTEPHTEPFGRTFAFKDADGRVLHAIAAV
jgi:predicted enzyme related to lactoylglutathione lyase